MLCGAVERLRGFRSVGDLLRVLLLHIGKGYSLRETAVRARHGRDFSPWGYPLARRTVQQRLAAV